MECKVLIEVQNLVKNYGRGEACVKALNDVSFCVERGEFIGIMGSSGSGKTTLLNILSTMDTMSGGRVIYDGIDISEINEERMADFRLRNLGFVFQEYNLLDTLTIGENIMLPMTLGGSAQKEIQSRVENISKTLHITDILEKFPYEVSGGQKQRAACARAIGNDPKLILADEPTGALDSKSSADLMDTLKIMNQELGVTILMVTHDAFSACYCDRILFLKDGRICTELRRNNQRQKDYLSRILDITSEADLTNGTVNFRGQTYAE